MVITTTRLMPARLTAITARAGLRTACSSALGPGTAGVIAAWAIAAASTVAAASMAGVATTVAASRGIAAGTRADAGM
jgi:hypothetical protein